MEKSRDQILEEILANSFNFGLLTQRLNMLSEGGRHFNHDRICIYLRHAPKEKECDEDAAASDVGLLAARIFAQIIQEGIQKYLPINTIYTSPKERAVQTAEEISTVLGKPVRSNALLEAPDFGDLKNQPEERKLAEIVGNAERFDMFAAAAQRLGKFYNEIKHPNESYPGPIMAVSHSPYLNFAPSLVHFPEKVSYQLKSVKSAHTYPVHTFSFQRMDDIGRMQLIGDEFHLAKSVIPNLNGYALAYVSLPDGKMCFKQHLALIDNTGVYITDAMAIGYLESCRLDSPKEQGR
ncbi:histidine phosphatase family protein [Candidatus Woesearchaeota archaeon]|nr:histidine phosphatase family protein [Candidatus Woesearchaeota archaeon]